MTQIPLYMMADRTDSRRSSPAMFSSEKRGEIALKNEKKVGEAGT